MLRRSECVLIAYLIWAAMVAVLFPVPPLARLAAVTLNPMIIAVYVMLAWVDGFRRRLFLGVIRDWFPFPLMLLAYREMGWFAIPQVAHLLEDRWVVWDRFVLGSGGRAAIELLGPVLPSILEIAYSLVYALAPFAVAMLYCYRRRERVDTFLFVFTLGVLLCYAQFPFWPSEPPRTVFPGMDFPAYQTIFRRFNWWLLGGYGIHTSVFPSAHVAGAFSTAIGMRRALPEHPWVGRFLFVMAVLIATATVYGRYHYLADAVAGLAMAVVAALFTRWIGGRAPRGSSTPVIS